MSKYLIPAVLGVLVLGSGLYLYSNNNTSQVPPAPVPAPVPTPAPAPSTSRVMTIQMYDDKYVPVEITINQGDTINFVNRGQNHHWPASNLHPTHMIYPEFDPKRGIAPGQSWSFKFDKAGVWRWHDHLYPTLHGVITVEAR